MAHSTTRSPMFGLMPPEAAGFVRRRLEEVGGLGLIIFGTLLVIGWLSYNPLDPAPNVAAPGPVRNLLGGFGAAASDLGLRTLGIGYRPEARWLGRRWKTGRYSFGGCQKLRGLPTQLRAGRHDDPALDDILQLPDITRPIVVFQSCHHIPRNRRDYFALLSSKLADKVFRQ